jgi:regulator of sigma E protease
MKKILNIIIVLIGINAVIAIHELGHWSMSHLFGVETPEFSIGIGPTLLSKQIGTTTFVLAALPIGGFVEILGMRHPAPGKESASFATQPYKHKALIMLGGILFNVLFAFIIFMLLGFEPPLAPKNPKITQQEHTPEESQELQNTTTPQTNPQKRPRSNVVGPLGIINIALQSLDYGAQFYFYFLALLSLNLAIFNLFPLPLLDGGQLLLSTIETVRGVPIPDDLYSFIMSLTMVTMIFFLLYITRQDIRQ